MDEEFMERHEEELLEKALEAAKKKFERDNVKLEESQEILGSTDLVFLSLERALNSALISFSRSSSSDLGFFFS
jgi:hypothetical protein